MMNNLKQLIYIVKIYSSIFENPESMNMQILLVSQFILSLCTQEVSSYLRCTVIGV